MKNVLKQEELQKVYDNVTPGSFSPFTSRGFKWVLSGSLFIVRPYLPFRWTTQPSLSSMTGYPQVQNPLGLNKFETEIGIGSLSAIVLVCQTYLPLKIKTRKGIHCQNVYMKNLIHHFPTCYAYILCKKGYRELGVWMKTQECSLFFSFFFCSTCKCIL